MTIVALIPARAGSQRIPGKNIKCLHGQPLIAYTIAAARMAGIFTRIIVSSNSPETLTIAERYGATPLLRPNALAADDSPDIDWVLHAVRGTDIEAFAILRPTSPFRSAATIQRAWSTLRWSDADSLRAVTPWTGHHPGKLWTEAHGCLLPVMTNWTAQAPYHSSPTQLLMPIWQQTASLEMARRRVVDATPATISGTTIAPFVVEGPDAFDLNTPEDWARAEAQIATGAWRLPAL